ncbi:DUF3853 family protein [Myroides odoratimimus]|nr:DUF3853 family protein [Myroides odoratimimus]MEC4054238.1 DUF3853 family protein [Myroides odoratimimus]
MEFMRIAKLFSCSISTVNKIKSAIFQYSNNIIVYKILVLEPFTKK